jgi:hypothetical protein
MTTGRAIKREKGRREERKFRDKGTGSQHTHLDPTRDIEDGMGRVRNRGDRKTEERRGVKKPEMTKEEKRMTGRGGQLEAKGSLGIRRIGRGGPRESEWWRHQN